MSFGVNTGEFVRHFYVVLASILCSFDVNTDGWPHEGKGLAT